jgi:hypothetical protein
MSEDPHAMDGTGADLPHATGDHGDDHGHDDHGHGHGEEPLGPLDPFAWGAGALGIAVGLVTIACFALATGAIALS